MNVELLASDALVRALGWTLVHSLWQGALAALVLLVLLPRLHAARQRYRAAYAALSLLFGAALVTFGWMYTPAGNIPAGAAAETAPVISSYFIDNQTLNTTLWQAIYGWFESRYPLIVAIWLLGFVFFLLRLGSGLWHLEHLRRRGTFLVAEHWHEKMAVFGKQLGIPVAVGLFESALVHTPTALGWLKPVVLLPVGLLNRLSPAEVEAILAHELAHIARRDWIFNLLQAFIEALFYYHPAVWWMSQLIRSERENACDDDALAATGNNRLAYAKALVQVQEMAKPAPLPALALGMSGSRRFLLLERIRRVLNQPQQKSQIMEKFIATGILLILLAFVGIRANHSPTLSAAFAQITEVPRAILGLQSSDIQAINDTLPKPGRIRRVVREEDNQRVEAEFRDGKLTRLNIDGKEVPESEFGQHRQLANDLRREIHAPLPPLPPMPPGMHWEIPAAPPAPPAPSRLSATKDGEGNTVILFERDGAPVEIRVKDGEVWVDGEKMEDGESIDLPGTDNPLLIWEEKDGSNRYFHFTPPTGFHFDGLEGLEELERIELPELAEMPELPELAEHLEELKQLEGFDEFRISKEELQRWKEEDLRWREDANRAVKEQMEQLREQLRDTKKLRKGQEKALEEQLRALQSDLKRQQKEQGRVMEEARKEMRRAQSGQNKAQQEMRRAQAEQAKGESFREAFKTELQRDGLISDPNNYSVKLSSEKLTVNGKEQSEKMRQKYLDFYRTHTGITLGENSTIQITENNN